MSGTKKNYSDFCRRGLAFRYLLVLATYFFVGGISLSSFAEEEAGEELYQDEEAAVAAQEKVQDSEKLPKGVKDRKKSDKKPSDPAKKGTSDETPEAAVENANDGMTDVAGENSQGKKSEKDSAVDVVDLSEVAIEEVETEWESAPVKNADDVTKSIRIEDIVEPPSEYHYASFDRPNPFLAPDLNVNDIAAEDPDKDKGKVDQNGKLVFGAEIPMVSPLQNYPIKDLTVKGIWQLETLERRAMIMTPKREGVIVKAGDPLSAGKVMEINKEFIVVREYRIKSDGSREYEDKEMYLGPAPVKGRGIIKLDPGAEPNFLPAAPAGVTPAADPTRGNNGRNNFGLNGGGFNERRNVGFAPEGAMDGDFKNAVAPATTPVAPANPVTGANLGAGATKVDGQPGPTGLTIPNVPNPIPPAKMLPFDPNRPIGNKK